MGKLERKDKKKAGRGPKAVAGKGAASGAAGPELEWLLDNGLAPLLEAEAASKTGAQLHEACAHLSVCL